MVKRATFITVNVFTVLVLYSIADLANPSKSKDQQENHAPLVKITAPENNSFFDWDSPLKYRITVSDAEDGDSKFDEITSNEVLLQVRYIADTSKIAEELNRIEKTETGLAAMRTSNCLNCHDFNSKLIGPSFYEINKRYPDTKANALLAKHVVEGSKGVWRNVTMPTHPELTKEETESMIDWIFKKGAEAEVSYFRGLEGAVKPKLPVESEGKGVLVLRATYIDHGLKDKPRQNLKGQDVIVISSRPKI